MIFVSLFASAYFRLSNNAHEEDARGVNPREYCLIQDKKSCDNNVKNVFDWMAKYETNLLENTGRSYVEKKIFSNQMNMSNELKNESSRPCSGVAN